MHRASTSSMALLAVLAIFPFAPAAGAETYYVAPDGVESNSGSQEEPWPSVNYALERVGGGHTILVRPGFYSEPISVPSSAAGTAERPTIIQSEVKWKAVISSTKGHGISTDLGCHWVVIDGFEVMSAGGDGIWVGGDETVVRNCYVHNSVRMGLCAPGRNGTVIERNLIEYNGQSPSHHHGIQASGSRLTIQANILRHNAGVGLYTQGGIAASIIAYNLIHGHHGDTAQVRIFSRKQGGANRFVHNTVVGNREAVCFHNSRGDRVFNNILIAGREFDAIRVIGKRATIQADHNLCVPRSPYDGLHTLSADPQFVDPGRATYWLKTDSPAIGKGALEWALPTDFWGRKRPESQPPDLGAFAYSLYLTTEAARSDWHFQWPYRYAEGPGYDVPDFWKPPLD